MGDVVTSGLPGAAPAAGAATVTGGGASAGRAAGGWAPGSVLRRALAWAPPLFLIHNTEEGIAMARWANRALPGLLEQVRAAVPPELLPPPAGELLARFQPPTAGAFAWSAALATVLPAIAYWAGAARGPRSRWTVLAVWLQAVFLVTVLVPHLAASLWLRRYTPGVATALLVNLPLSWVLLRAAVREGVVTPRALAVFGVSAAVALGVLAAALLTGGALLERMLAG